jgi:pimeloyl-ACP methyl ester carboxylesterase
MASDWSIPGAEGEPIIGNMHRPRACPDGPRATVLLAHGFKGYKDYGFFPVLAEHLASVGCLVHRFNFSHSGMTDAIETFERPELFERDSYDRQVTDLDAVIDAVADGTLDGADAPLVLLGHSRGGVAVLLAVGRRGRDGRPQPARVVSLSAPATCNPFTDEQAEMLLAEGALPSPSSRTGQALMVGRQFLQEQIDDPDGHDLLGLVKQIDAPVLVVHGAEDLTVPAVSADAISLAAPHATGPIKVEGGDHVFNTPNPAPDGHVPSPQLVGVFEAIEAFLP